MNEKTFSYDDVNFHKTFAPQDSYITKILELAQQNYCGSKEEISIITGIPTGKTSGKVVPHIKYAKYMGLISYSCEKGKYSLQLTELGILVLNEDPYLFEDITKLICHYNMADGEQGALIWSFLYVQLPLMLNDSISISSLKKKADEFFQQDVDFSPLKKAYTDGFWSTQNLIEFGNDFCIPNAYYNDGFRYLYAYTLLDSWDKQLNTVQEITTDQITETLFWNKRFGFDYDEMIFALEELEHMGYLQINKQLLPFTVIRTTNTSDILPHIYDSLG